MLHTIYIALGSNIGNRVRLIERAIGYLCRYGTGESIRSSLYETLPEGFVSPHPFLNGVIAIPTDKAVELWLEYTQQVERELGRTTKSTSGIYQDRPIDIDILLFDDLVGNYAEGRLTIPHPRMHLRRFVLEPLAEIAPNLIHPTKQKDIRTLLEAL